jgi:hypothetical protein
MSAFPGSPRLLKGGIALLDPNSGTVQQILPLQYNPDTLTRSLKIKGGGAENGDHLEALQLNEATAETVTLSIEIDATVSSSRPALWANAIGRLLQIHLPEKGIAA